MTAADVPADRVEAFVSLLGRHQRRVQQFVGSLVPAAADADDILQDTNLVLWREFERFEPGTNFGAWACTVAFNQVLAWRKKRTRDRLVFDEPFLQAVANELIESADRLEERAKALAGCVERLPAHHRELLRRRYTDGRPVETIAAEQKRTPDAVYRTLSRVREALYDCVSAALAGRGTG